MTQKIYETYNVSGVAFIIIARASFANVARVKNVILIARFVFGGGRGNLSPPVCKLNSKLERTYPVPKDLPRRASPHSLKEDGNQAYSFILAATQ